MSKKPQVTNSVPELERFERAKLQLEQQLEPLQPLIDEYNAALEQANAAPLEELVPTHELVELVGIELVELARDLEVADRDAAPRTRATRALSAEVETGSAHRIGLIPPSSRAKAKQ
jgi:hypothetical protein